MRSDRKQTIIFIIILLVMSMGIGYAFLTTTLTINGVSDIDSAVWDIHFENIQLTDYSIDEDQLISFPRISSTGTGITYQIHFNEPYDEFAFYVDIVNDGTLAAKLDDIIMNVNGSDIIEFPVPIEWEVCYYYDEMNYEIEIGDVLLPGERKTLLYYFAYDEVNDPSDLPTDNYSFNCSFELVFSQSSEYHCSYYYYVGESDILDIRETFPSNLLTYNTYQLALNNFDYNAFVRFRTTNDFTDEVSVGFVYEGRDYYLIGADGGNSYERNENLLISLFGEDSCEYASFAQRLDCTGPDGYRFNIYKSGRVEVSNPQEYGCRVRGTMVDYVNFDCGNLME